MTNHLRTLLANLPPSTVIYPGDEFIPSTFNSIRLTGTYRLVYDALFGGNPDRALVNWRCAEILGAIDAVGWNAFVTGLDSRITYDPRVPSMSGASAVTVVSEQSAPLYYGVPPEAFLVSGPIQFRWALAVTGATSLRVTSETPGRPASVTTLTFASAGTYSEAVTLPDCPVSVWFDQSTGNRWTLDYVAHPARTLSDVVASLDSVVAGGVADDLFGDDEPYASLRAAWQASDLMLMRLSAVVIAYAYRLEEARG